MKILIKFFASVREAAGMTEYSLHLDDVSEVSSSEILEKLLTIFPDLSGYTANISMAINKKYISEIVPIIDGDEVALIPPISGG
jgi:molybdopterin converting factor subunit 1